MDAPELCLTLLTQVTRFRGHLLCQGALSESDLDGHPPSHYLQDAQALLPLETALVTVASINTEVLSEVFRGFYRANELVQLTRDELATFNAIEQAARQLGTDA